MIVIRCDCTQLQTYETRKEKERSGEKTQETNFNLATMSWSRCLEHNEFESKTFFNEKTISSAVFCCCCVRSSVLCAWVCDLVWPQDRIQFYFLFSNSPWLFVYGQIVGYIYWSTIFTIWRYFLAIKCSACKWPWPTATCARKRKKIRVSSGVFLLFA